MRKSVLAAATAAAMLAGISVANAADVTGTIKSIDATAGMITLDNGKAYKLPCVNQGGGLEGRRKGQGDLRRQERPARRHGCGEGLTADAQGVTPSHPLFSDEVPSRS